MYQALWPQHANVAELIHQWSRPSWEAPVPEIMLWFHVDLLIKYIRSTCLMSKHHVIVVQHNYKGSRPPGFAPVPEIKVWYRVEVLRNTPETQT